MVKLIVYYKFTKVYEGKRLTHSGNQTFRGTTKPFCMWCADEYQEDMECMGWELLEWSIVEISYYGGCNDQR